jgi:CSLREA domain-containing protein
MLTPRPKWMKGIALLVIFGIFVGMLPVPEPVSASPDVLTTITVNSSDDLPDDDGGLDETCETGDGNGKCTLRAAIQTAENHTGPQEIVIDSTKVFGITVGETTSQALPPLASGGTTIKGDNTIINGSDAPSMAVGFELSSANNKIQGFIIWNFNHGVYISGGSNNVVGTDGDGVDDADEGNQIVTNSGDGVYISGDNNRVSGNLIGTGGTAANPNDHGVYIYSGTGNLIGTDGDGVSDTEERNIISGNERDGIEIRSSQNTVAGNYIGTDQYGTSAIPNYNGVLVTNGGDYNVIGTNGDGQGDTTEGNLISGNMYHGVDISGAGTNRNKVAGNTIGLDVTGSLALPNGTYGIYVHNGASNNYIGTDSNGQSDQAERNVVSGNDHEGVVIEGSGTSGNEVAGNYIGVNAAGTEAVGNETGVLIYGATGNTIGGTGVWSGNLISGNEYYGVNLYQGANNNTVIRNIIGANHIGMSTIPNIRDGVRIRESGGNEIGGSTTMERNLISGNGYSGVVIGGEGANGNIVLGNYIGVAVNGTTALGNSHSGISISTMDNIIGGIEAGAGNTIAYNGQDGVIVGGEEATGNSIRGNAIYNNNQIGIDLRTGSSGWGPTENDGVGDPDTGPNGYQNYPVLTLVEIIPQSGVLSIHGVLTSTPDTDFGLDVYLNNDCDPSGYGEGQSHLSDWKISGKSSGVSTFINSFSGSYTPGHFLTITATDPDGNTSEFSPCYEIVMGCRVVKEVRIVGDTNGYPGDYTFTTVITPASATVPISYLWDNGDTDSTSTRNLDVGTHSLTVTASNCGGDHAEDEHTIGIVEPPATCEVPLTGVTISGPTSGITGTTYTFSAAPEPSNATAPVTYNWTPEPDSGQGTTSASYSWDVAGEKTIAINAQNCGGARSDTYQIEIGAGTGPGDEYFIYLPLVVR